MTTTFRRRHRRDKARTPLELVTMTVMDKNQYCKRKIPIFKAMDEKKLLKGTILLRKYPTTIKVKFEYSIGYTYTRQYNIRYGKYKYQNEEDLKRIITKIYSLCQLKLFQQ